MKYKVGDKVLIKDCRELATIGYGSSTSVKLGGKVVEIKQVIEGAYWRSGYIIDSGYTIVDSMIAECVNIDYGKKSQPVAYCSYKLNGPLHKYLNVLGLDIHVGDICEGNKYRQNKPLIVMRIVNEEINASESYGIITKKFKA